MASAYERAIAFTTGLLDLRSQPPFQFPIGSTLVTATLQPDLVTGIRLEDSGANLGHLGGYGGAGRAAAAAPAGG